jgi:MFS family permease
MTTRAILAVAFAVLVPALITGLSLGAFPLLVVPWTEQFDITRSAAMSVFAGMSIGMTLTAPLIGWLVFKYSPRLVMALGIALLAVGLVLAGSANSFWLVGGAFALLVGFGASLAGALPATTAALAYFPDRAGALSGLIILGVALLGAAMPIIIALALEQVGWRFMLQAAGILILPAIPLTWIFLVTPKQTSATAEAATEQSSNASVLKAPAFWLIVAACLPLIIGLIVVQANIAVMAQDAGIDAKGASYLVSLISVGTALGSVAFGWAADRLHPRLVYAAAAALGALSLLAMLGPRGFYLLAISGVGLGFAGGSAAPLIAVLIVRSFGVALYPRVGGLFTPFMLPVALGPVAAGAIRDATGAYDLALIIAAALCVPGLLAIGRLTLPPKPSLAAA